MKADDFWTRRRAAVEAEELQQQRLKETERAEMREAALAEHSEEDILQELGLPDPDSLGQGDDFKVFLSEAVPERIRTRALRRLWGSNPVLANIDGLVDYGEDFTDAACVIENLQTAYQVGKGMTVHVEELARQAEAALSDEEDDAPASDTMVEADAEAPEPVEIERAITEPEEVQLYAEVSETEIELPEAPAPVRRMRFRFEAEGAEI
jgi:hypothetical protein